MKNMIKLNVVVLACVVAYMLLVSHFAHAELELSSELDSSAGIDIEGVGSHDSIDSGISADVGTDSDAGDVETQDSWDLSHDFGGGSGAERGVPDDGESERETPASNNNGSNRTCSNAPAITLAEVHQHNTGSSCWIIILGGVYDVTQLITTHTGGNVFSCGADNTAIYVGQHGTGTSLIQPYLKGPLDTASAAQNQSCAQHINSTNPVPTGSGSAESETSRRGEISSGSEDSSTPQSEPRQENVNKGPEPSHSFQRGEAGANNSAQIAVDLGESETKTQEAGAVKASTGSGESKKRTEAASRGDSQITAFAASDQGIGGRTAVAQQEPWITRVFRWLKWWN